VRMERTYIYGTGGKSIRARPLDCNDGAARRVAPANGPDPKLRKASCLQVSLSQVRDAYGPHDGNEHTRRAIASDGVHSAQQSGPADVAYSFPPNAPRRHSARDSGRKFCGWRIVISPTIPRDSPPCYHSSMRHLVVLFIHFLATLVRLLGPGGVRSLVAESLLLKHQLLLLNRSRQRSPNLRASDRFFAGWMALLVRPTRLLRSAIVLKSSTLLALRKALSKQEYRMLFSPKRLSGVCVLGCCALRGSSFFTPTISVRQRPISTSGWLDSECQGG
jgi:hypothetical protein